MQGMNINAAAPNTTAPSMPQPPPVSGVPPDKGHFTTRDWYYGPITRAQCDDVLNQRGHDGDFLIRDSETNVRTYFLEYSNVFFPLVGISVLLFL